MTNHDKERPERLEKIAADLDHEAEVLEKKEHELKEEASHLREEARRERKEEHEHRHRRHHETIEITMVVNGQPVVIEAHKNEALAAVRQKALEKTENLAQPPENWEIKNEAGQLLDAQKKVGEFDFGEKVTLFLSLKAGVAGH